MQPASREAGRVRRSEETTILSLRASLEAKLNRLYGDTPEGGGAVLARLEALTGPLPDDRQPRPFPFTERDAILITYADQLHRQDEAPLATLHSFLKGATADMINTVHLLPFFPYSSDDGFSVIDYTSVNPSLGGWQHIRALRTNFRLMFDAVLNHISAQSQWFRAYLRGEAPYDGYFIEVDPATDLSMVRRPRTLPLLTRFVTARGERYVWTTFSDDQIDLNFANPDVLLDIVRILLFYVQQGASLIRLDAIAYLWKIIGTSCIHLEETHRVVQVLRDVLDAAAPHVQLITETNVPHDENISYFGDGANEAQMVYQFALPPLILHTLRTGDARPLSAWAAALERPGETATFFNFTASHDGVGVTPLRGILPDADIDALVALAEEHGGFVSYKHNNDGTRSPYELNISYFDAVTHPSVTAANPGLAVQRFICSQAIMLAMVGVPGVYFHSLFGSRNWRAGAEATGRYRSINREKLDIQQLVAELNDPAPNNIRRPVFKAYRDLLRARRREAAFHPLGAQAVLDLGAGLFGVERTSPDKERQVLALHNVSAEPLAARVTVQGALEWRDLLTGGRHTAHDGALNVALAPFQVCWLKRGGAST
jgi:sucrose phosphorylase